MKNKIKILVLDNQIINNPESGGPLRIYNLFGNLSSDFEVTYLGVSGWQYLPKNKKKIKENFYEQIIPLSKIFIVFNNLLHNTLKSIPTFDLSCAYFLFLTPSFKKVLKKEAKNADIIITSHPWFINYISSYKNKIKIYDSHNCEYALYKSFMKKTLLNKFFLKILKNVEKKACNNTNLTLACSNGDKNSFISLYKTNPNKIKIIPNPISIENIKTVNTKQKKSIRKKHGLVNKKTVIFIGSYFMPNIEAFNFIFNYLSKKLKNFTFLIVGDVNRVYLENLPKQIEYSYNIQNSANLGFGWFDLEKWGHQGFNVRWTKKEFNFFINDKNITELEFKYRSLKKIFGYFKINNKSIGKIKFHTGVEFKKVKIPIKPQEKIEGHIILNRLNKSLFFDVRDVGIAIKSISYVSNGENKYIDLTKTIVDETLPDNVKLYGKVSTTDLNELLNISNIAINPVIHGSGHNIKMLDYMSFNIPIVTTPVGARGLDIKNNPGVRISNLRDFEKNIIELDKLKKKLEKDILLSKKVKTTFDSKIISKELKEILIKLISKKRKTTI